jgi:hypothetical protein
MTYRPAIQRGPFRGVTMSANRLHNAGTLDRSLRAILGLVLLSLAFVGPKTPWGYIGAILLLTAMFGFCPLYTLLGINTCPNKTA